jgi:hypothetical protein
MLQIHIWGKKHHSILGNLWEYKTDMKTNVIRNKEVTAIRCNKWYKQLFIFLIL